MPLLVLGLSHHTAPVELREQFAFAEGHLPEVLQGLRDAGLADEAVVLSTCNRVELYVVTSSEPRRAFAELKAFLREYHNHEGELGPELYELGEPQSIEHLFRVACGLDSMVLGETEVLGQLKKAYDLALRHRHTGSRLNRTFQRAFNVAKQVRSETHIQRGTVSVASVAVELAEKIFNSLSDRHVMIIGAGETSEKAARALLSRGAKSILVSNRSYDRAQALARELNGRAVHFEAWAEEFQQVDIVISSTSAPHCILDRSRMEPLMAGRRNQPMLLVDIAVPRDIDPEVNFVNNIYLYNVDDLQAIADSHLRRRKDELALCESIIREKARALGVNKHSMGFGPGTQPVFGHE